MPADIGDRDFVVIYVGGPKNGFVERGDHSLARLKDEAGHEIGRRIRALLPWYVQASLEEGIKPERLSQLHEMVGIEPWGDPVYELIETVDPKVYKYEYIGEYSALKLQGVVS